MADEKKSKPALGVTNAQTAEHVTSLPIGMLLLGALASALLAYLENLNLGAAGSLWKYFLEHIWPVWKIIAAILSALAAGGIIYNTLKLRAINLEEQKIYGAPSEIPILDAGKLVEPKNEKWQKIIGYMNSNNASDWRLAIIEADVMLEELLRTMGYGGESVGEMLKSVDKNEFLTIEDAWEAHKMRNAVAHSGGTFQLNERETKRTISLFEKVFKEFGVV